MSEYHPFEIIPATGKSPILLVCDHATNIVPASVQGGDLGLPDAEMNRHIAFDIGARAVTVELARLLGATAVLSRFSRLVIDPNRGEEDPTLVMKLYDGTIIPANRHVDAAEVTRRLDSFHRPYHRAITQALDAMLADGLTPQIISMHSFTPRLKGRAERPWHIGVLWDRDDRIVMPLMDALRADGDIVVGDNEPYSGELRGDCMYLHGTSRGLPHALIEIRHDLIDDAKGQKDWAARLAKHLSDIILIPEQ